MHLSVPAVLKRYRVLFALILILGLAVLSTYLAAIFGEKKIEQNWESISNDENIRIRDESLALFKSYEDRTLDFSNAILSDRRLVSALINQNPRKSYEYLINFEQLKENNVEVYNSRLELVLYYGRQINPETVELTRAFSGESFSTVKQIGFFTYLLVYRPLRLDTADVKKVSQEPELSQSAGVLVTSGLIDVDHPLKNSFFRNFGLTYEILTRTGANVEFDFSQSTGVQLDTDTTLLRENNVYSLEGIGGDVVGRMYVPKPEKISYIQESYDKFVVWISTELYLLSSVILVLVFYFITNLNPRSPFGRNHFLKVISVFALLCGVRYFWLLIDFPQKLLDRFDVIIFSPSYYASTFAFGIARSIAELLVTSTLVLIFSLYLVSLVTQFSKEESGRRKSALNWALVCLGTLMIFVSLQIYGHVIHSLVFDSNLKYYDTSQIISTDNPQLLLMQFAMLLVSVSLIIIVLSGSLLACISIAKELRFVKFARKNSVILVFAGLVVLNLILEYVFRKYFSFSLEFGLRNLILGLTGLYVYFFHRQMSAYRNYRYVRLLNISLTLLICAEVIPETLLSKIMSQENRYIELIARKLSEQVNDKVTFVLSSNLEDLSDNPSIESDVKNQNKLPQLAFNIWSKSKLSSENLNSAVYVLDTAMRLISDFNTNPAGLNTDSVIKFALGNWHMPDETVPEEEAIEPVDESDLQEETGDEWNIEGIAENPDLKYYYGIRAIERSDLRYSKFRSIVGYVLMAVQYDSRKYMSQPGSELFFDFTKDNLENKLVSRPVISEFTNDELTGSSDREVSKSFAKSIEAFRESVKDKIDKSTWRYDQFEGTNYKSFYILSSVNLSTGGNTEKIFLVSSKVSDFGTKIFFAFKNLIFIVIIYTIFLLLYALVRLLHYFRLPAGSRHIIFGYREKLFVAFFVVSVIPIIILAAYTRSFVENKNTQFYNEQLISDLKIVNQYINNKIPPADAVKKGHSQDYLTNLSNVFGSGFPEAHKNFNLFVKTKLVSTTNEELYKSDLLDTRLSANAFYNIILLKKDYFAENQEIGDFKFIVGYKPVFDSFNNLLGIVSSQTFFKQYEINEELTESLVYILGTYIVAVIFLVFIVNILSYRISNPIIKLLRATEQLSKGNVEIQVKSRSKDEIGELVKSFNKMIRELKRSREELKRAERESAWRDIARQVAHEIKNPLTPIKLAMQHLYRTYSRSPKSFKSTLQATHQMIIDQIESLNNIATEFSDFAKMPSRNYEPLAVEGIITEVVNLFGTSKTQLRTNFSDGNVKVFGDKDELKRALINIIRNSLQAIEQRDGEDFKGKINIESYQNSGYYWVRIKDNGIGMDEDTIQKLFEPYFSTKSKGMGLGLVITKKIIDDMKGRISVKSEPELGTEVEIRFKVWEKEQS